jgi:phosphoribosylaminoimidazole-succinocarboxamide synthase
MMQSSEIVYEGADRRVFGTGGGEDRLYLEISDHYSIFDWGRMPDRIANRGRALSVIAAYIFEHLENPETWQHTAMSPALKPIRSDWLERRWNHLIFCHWLAEHGAPTHYRALVGPDSKPLSMKEAAASGQPVLLDILKSLYLVPRQVVILEQPLFFYQPPEPDGPRFHVPLEFVFRFGIAPGDPLTGRLTTDRTYRAAHGLEKQPEAPGLFERPVLEFYTRLEPHRRLLDLREALLISGLTPGHLEEAIELSYNIALALLALFAGKGLQLWEGKLEYVAGPDGLRLADSVGPDRLRLFYEGTEVGDGFLRNAYAATTWAGAQAAASSRQQFCRDDLKAAPEPLAPGLKAQADLMYGVLANHIVGRELFDNHPSLAEFVASAGGS